MQWPFRICCAVLIAAGVSAQSPQIPDTNPFSSDADIQQGAALFQTHCSYCHGSSGEGGRGADLTAGIYRRGGSDPELYASDPQRSSRQRNGTGASRPMTKSGSWSRS